jgi:protocatechuate 3,4-dioxygenase beta subunit
MKTTTRFAAVFSLAAALLLAAAATSHAEDAKPAAGTASISGKVTDASGNPAANVHVMLNNAQAGEKPTHTAKDPNKKAGKGAPALATTTTDSQGQYKFEGLAAGEYNVSAGGKGLGHGTQKVTLKDGEKGTADIQLTAPKKAPAKAN